MSFKHRFGLWFIGLFSVLLILQPIQHMQAQGGTTFPVFGNQTRVLSPSQLIFNPTNEIIFPSIIRIADYVASPLATYYLYYAPHDAPGGINLAYSNSLNGPWTEYASNPVIANTWQPHYNVSHVSSPDVIWDDTTNKLFMYFHGENNTTRLANSTNGINFTYDKVVVNTANFTGINEASYARVFRHTMPSVGNKYMMLLMGNNNGTRRIYRAWSNDGRNWTTQASAFISPPSGQTQLSSANFLVWNNKYYVVYHSDLGNMYAHEVDANFNVLNYAGLFYDSLTGSPDDAKASSPEFITAGNTLYMFYATGPRLDGKLASATASIGGVAEEIIVDNTATSGVTVTGAWSASTGAAGYYGTNYLQDGNAGKGTKSVQYVPNIVTGGTYQVYVRHTAHPNRATNVPIDITHGGVTTTVTVNQQANGGAWVSVGSYVFSGGAGASGASVTIRTTGTNGYVVADAVRFVRN